jgi:hypothetical protein
MKSSAMSLAISFHIFFVHALQRTTETMKAICNAGRLFYYCYYCLFRSACAF